MKDETALWLKYAQENLESAKLLLDNNLYNPSLQNIQQCTEKALKAFLIEKNYPLKRTHSINELKNMISSMGEEINISDDDCDFLDTIYLPSKYPMISVIPDFNPNQSVAKHAVEIGESVINEVKGLIK